MHVIVQAADTITAARPGARRETLGDIHESSAAVGGHYQCVIKGVEKSYAIQAGREVRIMVSSGAGVSDADMVIHGQKRIKAD